MNITKIYQKGIICVGKHLHIHILFLPILLAAYLGNYLVLFSICWISALLHEFAHIFVLRRFGIPVSHIVIQPFGVCAKISTAVIKNPVHEILMALAGPFINLIISVLCFIILQYLPISLIGYCMAANLSIFCLNLLPCLPLDGGRVMRALLTLGSDAVTALKISVIVSRIIIALLLCTAVWLLLTSSFNFSLILIGAFLLGNLCFEQKAISMQVLRELLYYRSKPESGCFSNVCTIAAYGDLPARKLLHRLSYHKYHVVHVLDSNRKITKTLTEGQILKSLLNKSIRLTLDEIN